MTLETALLQNELIRTGTYIGWPRPDFESQGNIKPNILELVHAGFYFTGSEDIVRCCSCGLEIKVWKSRLDPYLVHANKSPHCVFIMGNCNDNRPRRVNQIEQDAVMANSEAAMHTSSDESSSIIASNTSLNLHGQSLRNSFPLTDNSLSISNSDLQISLANNPNDNQNVLAANRSVYTSMNQISSTVASQSTIRNITSSFPDIRRITSKPQKARSDVIDLCRKKNTRFVTIRQHSSPYADHVKFQDSEEARIQTFSGWTGIRATRAREFAEAGFIYIGPEDRVQCVFCGGVLRKWKNKDLPLAEHHKYFPDCSFAVESLAAKMPPMPRHSKYKSEPSRLSSFYDWDPDWLPKPAELAKAGFFYAGWDDRVRCFFCNGALCHWEPHDDPWAEHARWFPKCPYVRQSKGQAFINGVLSNRTLTNQQRMLQDKTDHKIVTKRHATQSESDRVMSQMVSPVARAVLSMGVPKKLVKMALKKKLTENGEGFTSTGALLETVCNINRELETESEMVTRDINNDDETGIPSSRRRTNHNLWLAEENRLLKEQKQCKVCLDEDVCITFIPCGHLMCCSSCAPSLKVCPICRAKIKGMIRTYMS